MVVTEHENEKYRAFVRDTAIDMGVFEFEPEQIVWHYTDGQGFLGIVQSATIYATQVASLNDKNETKYATDLYKDVVAELIKESAADEQAVLFLRNVLEFVKEEPDSPTHGTSKFFVTCFSADENDLNQWRLYGKKNGYAIGFRARGLFREATSQLYKVIYDREKQRVGAKKIAEATLRFFREGLIGDRAEDPAA